MRRRAMRCATPTMIAQIRKDGLQVRAGVRDIAKAAEYLQTATSFGLLPGDASRRVQLVQVDITDPDSIGPAIGSASKVGPQIQQVTTSHIELAGDYTKACSAKTWIFHK